MLKKLHISLKNNNNLIRKMMHRNRGYKLIKLILMRSKAQIRNQWYDLKEIKNQRTNGPVNAHLISWPSKAQNIHNLENIWQRNDLDLQYSHTFIISISCLNLPTFRSQAAIVSEISTDFTFSP